ncbi:mevalonate kinase [Candidatus Gottesmanbacteria bacterium]|nr:mevalonate kinase [Candidatus Gottesmanbacteria bacterium]
MDNLQKTISISAPGKLLLFGEHAVVYGYPCIVSSVSDRLTVTIYESEKSGVEIQTPGVSDQRFIHAAIQEFEKRFSLKIDHCMLSTSSEFSSSFGFGSSSAVTVATMKALSLFTRKNLSQKELIDACHASVLSVQGVGSGFDVASSLYGGTILYEFGGKRIELLLMNLPGYSFVVGYTGEKADTVSIVKEVAEKREKYTEKVDRIFQAIGDIVLQAKTALEDGDATRLGILLNYNQEYLRDLGVSSEKLEILISVSKKAGALGAKLSGAGRGDCMIALVSNEKKSAVEDAIEKSGGTVMRVFLGVDGAKIASTDNQEELFIVVDKNDEVIGYRSRADCHSDKTLIHRSLDVVIFNDNGEILLQKRSMTKDTRPGYWGVSVGGHVSKGETYEDAAKREMKEELGVVLPVTTAEKFLFEYPHETEIDVVFTANSNGPFTPNTDEIDEVKFFSKNELSRKLLDPTFKLTELSYECLKRIKFL